jgi:hypothetical protein
MSKSQNMALIQIMELLALPGELCSDGQVVDEIISIIKEINLPFDQEQSRMERAFKKNQYLEWENMTLEQMISKLQESE